MTTKATIGQWFVNIFEPLVRFMRERVCMTTLATPIGEGASPYYPKLISVGKLMDLMGYPRKSDIGNHSYGDSNDQVDDLYLGETLDFIKGLPIKLTLLGETNEGRDMMVRGSEEEASIHNSDAVNVQLMNHMIGNRMKLVERKTRSC